MNCQMTSAACALSSDAATSPQPQKRTLSPQGLRAYKEFVCRRVRGSYAIRPGVYDGCYALPDDPDWVVSKLLNEVNGSAEDFFRACQAELYWTQQIHPENLLVSFKVVGMLSAFFFPGAQYDGTVNKEVGSSHQSSDGKQPVVTPERVSPVSVVTPPTELTTITRKRRKRDKQKSNKKKGKPELPVGDGATIFFNCEKD